MTRKPKYKCRLCGARFFHGEPSYTDENVIANVSWAMVGKKYEGKGPTMIMTHECDDCSIGIADFIGYEIMKGD